MRRPAPPRDIPPPLELECLKVLWRLGEGSVRSVREELASRQFAYTTVMTLLRRLEQRGCIRKRKQDRYFIYTPSTSREALAGAAVKELLNTYFDGSPEALRTFLGQAF
jgi:BlaI family transcriptional regulator, penicillinase repressor